MNVLSKSMSNSWMLPNELLIKMLPSGSPLDDKNEIALPSTYEILLRLSVFDWELPTKYIPSLVLRVLETEILLSPT